MKKLVLSLIGLLALTGVTPHLLAQAPEISGNWQGTITLPNGKGLRTIIVIAKDDGVLKSTFYSIDQGAQSFKSSSTKLDGTAVAIDFSAIGISYQGKLAADANSITGTFSQGGNQLPLNLLRATKDTAWEIPAPPPPRKLMAADAKPTFDVATIKPNNTGATSMQQLTLNGRNFATRASSLGDLMAFAYNVQLKQIIGAPDWLTGDRYDIAAVPDAEGDPNIEQLRLMLRKLLTDRFKLTFHHDQREMSAFVLSVSKTGPKLTPTQITGSLPGIGFSPGKGGLTMNVINGTMGDFTTALQGIVLDRPVVDQTALSAKYDFQITFAPDESQFNGRPPKLNGDTPGADAAPGLFEAVQQQIGLKLEARKTAVDVLVIDHVEKPTAN